MSLSNFLPGCTMNSRRFLHQAINSLMIVLTLVWPIVQPLNLQAADYYWDTDTTDVGNLTDGTGLGGNGTWDLVTSNWWPIPAAALTTYVNGSNVTFTAPASTIPSVNIVTLGVASGVDANKLTFQRSGYVLSGGDLTLSGGAGIAVNFAETATINSQLLGSAGLTKTGGGALRLAAGNLYTGTTTINSGSIVINNGSALGTDASTIVVNGNATRGFGGGSLVLEGTRGGVGANVTRAISILGLGPNSDRGAALQSVRDNTITGLVSSSTGAVVGTTRITSTGGTLTLAGAGLDVGGTALTTFTQIGSLNQGGVGMVAITGNLTGAGILEKSGTGTLMLSPSSSAGFSGSLRLSSSSATGGTTSTVRISSPNVLGTRTAATTGSVLDFNGGNLEVLMDAPSILAGGAAANVYQRNSANSIFVDHAIGGNGAINQTATFGNLSFDVGNTFTFNGRDGYGITFGAAPVNTATGSQTFANNLNGNLTFTSNIWSTTDNAASRTMTFSGNGNTFVLGNVLATAAAFNHNLTKSGTGTLTLAGVGATLDGNTNIQGGALTISDWRSINANATSNNATLNIGTGATAATLNIGTTTNAATAAGLTGNLTHVINLLGTTGGATINANQAQAFPVIIHGNITSTGVGVKTLTLGGTSTQSNIINGNITNNSATNRTSLVKADAGTWVLGGNNAFTGNVTVTGGTLELKASQAASNIVENANSVTFDTNAVTQGAGGTLQFRGIGAATSETLGSLNATNGIGTVNLISTGFLSNLTFGSTAGNIGKGSGVNFVIPSQGNVSFTGLTASTATTILGNGHFYFNGNDFARSNSTGSLVRPLYGTDAGFSNTTTSLIAGVHNQLIGNITQAAPVSITSLKLLTNQTLTLGALADVNINTGGTANDGGILSPVGNSTITSTNGKGITTGGTGALVFRVNGSATNSTLTLGAPILANSTGGITKNGPGVLVLQNVNSQSGDTTINEGIVRLGGVAGNATLSANGNPLVIRQSGTLDLNGFNSTSAISNFNGAGNVTNSAAGTVSILQVGNSNGTGTFSGVIQDGNGTVRVIKQGTGGQTWSGLSTYTGNTTLGSAGTVTVNTLSNIGQASGIGAGNATDNAGSLVFSGVTTGPGLTYVGAVSVSIDRLFTLNGNATISNNSANQSALIFNNAGSIAIGPNTTNQAISLTLGGTSTGDSRFNPAISNPVGNVTALTKIGAGTWILGGTSTYSGNTTIVDGILGSSGQDGVSLSSNSPLILGSGATNGVFQTSGNFTRNITATPTAGAGTVTWNQNNQAGAGGFAASGDKLVVALGGLGSPTALTWGSGGFVGSVANNQTLVLSSATAYGETEFRNGIDLNGLSRTITVNDNTNTATDFATLSGNISGGAGSNLIKAGTGVLQLLGDSSYAGNTTINSGTLVVRSFGNSAVPGTSSVGTTTGANTQAQAVVIGAGGGTAALLQYIGAGETSDRMIRLNSTTGSTQIFADGSGALVLTNVLNDGANGNHTLSLRGSNSAGNMISSILADTNSVAGPTQGVLSVTADSAATWILSGANTYVGSTTLSGGPLGYGSSTAFGVGNVTINGGSLFAYGADRTISNPLFTQSSNAAAAYIGDYSVNIPVYTNALTGANDQTITNNIGGVSKNLTIGSMTLNSLSVNRTQNFNGTGDTIVGGISSSTAFRTAISISGGAAPGSGSVTFAGPLTILENNNLNISNGAAKFSTNNVFPTGTSPLGVVNFNPGTGRVAKFDLNGTTQTINGITNSVVSGLSNIDNSSSTAGTLVIGDNNFGSTVGAAGNFSITNTGAALSLTKIGTGSVNLGGGTSTLSFNGTTTVTGGLLNLMSAVSTTAVDVGTSGTLKLSGGFTNPGDLTSVTVASTAGAAFTGGTLSLASGLGQSFSNLSTLNLGAGGSTTYLELDVGDSGTDTLSSLVNAATTAGTINFLIKDIDISNNATYDLLVAPNGGLSGATYTFSLAGYVGSTLFANSTVVRLTSGTINQNSYYWSGTSIEAGNSTKWNAVDDGDLNTNFSNDTLAVNVIQNASNLPGKGQKIIFQADSILGPVASLNTTLEQDFKINALQFQASTVMGNTPSTIRIAPGANAASRLTLVPGNSTDGINLMNNGTARVIISAALTATGNQTWNVADASVLNGATTTLLSNVVTVADTSSLRPGMSITGTAFAANTTILSITDATNFVVSANATGAAVGTQSFYAAQQLNIAAPLSGNGTIAKTGLGKLVLGNATTTFTGSFAANGGVTEINNISALGGTTVAGVGAPISIGSNGTFLFNGAASTVTNNLTLAGGTLSAGSANQIYSGAVNISGNSTISMRDQANVNVNATARNINLPGVLSGAGKLIIDGSSTLASGNANTGTLTLTGNNSGWSGGIDFVRGTVTANASNSSNGTGPITFKGVAAHYTGNASQQGGRIILQGLAGGTTTYNSSLNFESATVGEFQADNISAALTSNYLVNQNGTVNLGTLGGNGTGATARIFLADTSSAVNFNGGVMLNGNSSLTVAGGGTLVGNTSLLSINNIGINESVAGSRLDINDELGVWGTTSNRIAINAAGNYTGGTTLNEGTLILGNATALGTGALSITNASALQGSIDLDGANALANALNIGGTLTVSGLSNVTINGLTTGTAGDASRTLNSSLPTGKVLVLGGNVNLGNATNTVGRTLTIGGTGSTTILGNIVDGNAFANGLTITANGTLGPVVTTLSGTNSYSGLTTLNASNSTLLLLGSNSSSIGNTTMSGGKIQFNNASNGGLAGGLLTLSGGTLEPLQVTSLSNNSTLSGSISVIGSQNLTMSGVMTQSAGSRTLTNTLTSGNVLSLADVNLSDSATARTLTIAGNGTTTIGNVTNSLASNTLTNNAPLGSLTISQNVFLSESTGAARTLTLAGNASTLINGSIQDANGVGLPGNFTVTNTGITTLTGANTYSGVTVMSAAAGTLLFNGTNSSLVGNTTLTTGKIQFNNPSNGGIAGGLLTLTAGTLEPLQATSLSNNSTLIGAISVIGNQSLMMNGVMTQSGSRTLTNTLSAGNTLRVQDLRLAEAATARTLIITGNGTTVIGNLTNNGANNVITSSGTGATPLAVDTNVFLSEAVGTGRTLTVAGNGNTTISGVVQNFNGAPGAAGGLTKTGSGILTLSNTNTYSGTTTIVATSGLNQGVILASANNALGTGNVTAQFNTGALSSQIQLTGNITLGNGIFTTTGAGNSTDGISGIIRSVSGDNVISGSLNLIGGGGDSTYRADTGASLTVNGNVGSAAINTDRTAFLVGGGNFTFAGPGVLRNSNLAVPGTERLNVDSGNTGTTTLSGINTYTGTTTVGTNSTLIAGSAQAFGIGSNTTVIGTLRLAGNNNTVGPLSGNGVLENANASNATLTFGDATNRTFSGVAQDGTGGGALSLTKVGAGIFTLSGNNTNTGTIAVDAGTLSLTGQTGVGSLLAVGTAGTLTGTGTANGNATLTGSGVINLTNPASIAGTLGVTGGNWTGAGSVGGLVTSSSGTFDIGSGAVLTANGGLAVTGGSLTGSGSVIGNATLTGGATINLTNPASISGTLGVTGGNWTGAGSVGGLVTSSSGTFDIGSGAVLTANGGLAVTGGSLTGSGSVIGNATLTGGATINLTNPASISGTLGVTGGNWTGAGSVGGLVTSSSGAFNIGSDANLTADGGLNVTGGTIAAGNSTSTITGSVNYTSLSNSTFGGVLAGTNKTLTLNASGTTLTLSGGSANTFSGQTIISNGTLLLNKTPGVNAIIGDGISSKGVADVLINGGTLKLGANHQLDNSVTINQSSGTFNVNGKTETLFNYVRSGGAYVAPRGSNITFVDPVFSGGDYDELGTVTYGNLEISGGNNTIHGDEGSGFGGAVATIGPNGLLFSGTNSPKIIVSSENGVAADAGKIILDSDVSFTGASGTAEIKNGNRLTDAGGPGPWTDTGSLGSNNGLLDLNGAVRTFTIGNGTAAVDMSISAQIIGNASAGLTKAGLGTLLLTNNNTYDGATAINAGALIVNGDQTAANGAVSVGASGTLAGSGTIGGATAVSGTLSPGATLDSAGTLTFNDNLNIGSGTFVWNLLSSTSAGPGTNFDQVKTTGGSVLTIDSALSTATLLFNGTGSTVDWTDGFWASNQSWKVFDNISAPSVAGGIFGNFGSPIAASNFLDINNASGSATSFFSWSTTGNNVFLNYTAVPEPASLGGAVVLFGSWVARRRMLRKKKTVA